MGLTERLLIKSETMQLADNIVYNEIDQHTWSTLFARQREAVAQYAYSNFLPALDKLGLSKDKVPLLNDINQHLFPLTGWMLYPVPGLIENAYFFDQMRQQRFGSTTWLRKPEQLDYLEEPDMFHDIFGHIPLLADKSITDFLSAIASFAAISGFRDDVVEAIARLYWYTVEFGLIKENGQLKILGAGILSSIGETAYCMGDDVNLVTFNLEEIIVTPYIKDSFQTKYFVLEDLSELRKAAAHLKTLLQE